MAKVSRKEEIKVMLICLAATVAACGVLVFAIAGIKYVYDVRHGYLQRVEVSEDHMV